VDQIDSFRWVSPRVRGTDVGPELDPPGAVAPPAFMSSNPRLTPNINLSVFSSISSNFLRWSCSSL
jgi:hypothetical protein